MKNIKLFKYKSTNEFIVFVGSCGYKLEDVVGFSLDERKQHCGNTFKEYCIYFKDDECANFKVVTFKNFHDYQQAHLGFSGNKLFDWFEDADIRACQKKNW